MGATSAACEATFNSTDAEKLYTPARASLDTYKWRIGRLIDRTDGTKWKCLCKVGSKGDSVCGREFTYTPGNTGNLSRTHPLHFKETGIGMSDAELAQRRGNSSGGHYHGARNFTARRMLKLKILFVCVMVFNSMHPEFSRSSIWEQFMFEMEPSFIAPHRLMFGRIVYVMYIHILHTIKDRLHTVLELYNGHPYATGSLDHWTSKHSKLGFAAIDMQFTAPDTGQIEAYTLHVGHMPGLHTVQATAAFFQSTMPLYGFAQASCLFFVACSDGGINAFNAMVELGLLYGVVYCYCHRMHLSIKRPALP